MSVLTNAIKASNMFAFINKLMILIYVIKHARKESIPRHAMRS